MPLWAPASDWKPPVLSELPSWDRAQVIGYDTETKDPFLQELGIGVRRGGQIVGISFAFDDGPEYYVPLRHAGGGNVDPEQGLRYFRDNSRKFTGTLVGANIAYDLDYSAEEGIDFSRCEFIRDVQVVDPLIYELHQSFRLGDISLRWGHQPKDENLLIEAAEAHGVDPKTGLHLLHSKYVGPYAERDGRLPLNIWKSMIPKIDQLGIWDIVNLESRLTPVLVKMRRRGVRIDFDQLDRIEAWSLQEQLQELDKVYHATGVRIQPHEMMQTELLASALSTIGVQLGYTAKGQINIDSEVLDHIDHPVANAIKRSRKLFKLRSTFVASIRRYQTNGRIHCTFNQSISYDERMGKEKGAAYGRLSSCDPNLQQQPSRDEFAKAWRAIYLPEECCIWGSTDLSQQEPRWVTHFAAAMRLPGAWDAVLEYRNNPRVDNHTFMAKLTGIDRKYAKSIYLGICYNQGGAKLCRILGYPTRWALRFKDSGGIQYFAERHEAMAARTKAKKEGFIWEAAGPEGQAILDAFDARAPFIRQLAKRAEAKAKLAGVIRTGGGRLLHFPQRDDGSFDWTQKALNRLIQGTSGDQVKLALVTLDREFPDLFIQLQVHDEIDGSYSSIADVKKVATVMSECMPALIPFRVDVEVGKNWGDIELICGHGDCTHTADPKDKFFCPDHINSTTTPQV